MFPWRKIAVRYLQGWLIGFLVNIRADSNEGKIFCKRKVRTRIAESEIAKKRNFSDMDS